MKALLTWSTILVLAVSWLPLAQAQEGGYVAPSIIYTQDDGDRLADAGFNGVQVSFGRMIHEHLDLEGMFGYSNLAGYSDATISVDDVRITDFSANLLWYPNRDWKVAPYLIAGVGYLSAVPVSGQSTAGVSTTFGIGATWQIGDGPYSIRGEIRGRSSDGLDPLARTTGTMTDTVATLGFQYDFADRSSATSLISGDGGWYIGGDIAFTVEDKDRVTSSGTGPQFRVGKRLSDSLDVEGLLGFAQLDGYSDATSAFPDQTVLDFGVNLLAYPNRDLRVAPYFLIGIGYLGTEYKPGDSESELSSTVGAGFNWHIGDSAYSIRGEYRLRSASGTRAIDGTNGTLTDGIASLGVRYDFGAKQRYSEDDDSDGDGVLDIWDDCPNTEPGVEVSSRGCPLRDLRTDADGDRVPDDIDECPNTPVGQVEKSSRIMSLGCIFALQSFSIGLIGP